MASKFGKAAPIGLPVQLMHLKQMYSKIITNIGIQGSVLSCTVLLKPSMESETYRILITYKLSDYSPSSWLIEPHVELHDGKLPEHIYGVNTKGHPCLCVYYPKEKEWVPQMLIATSYLPWILTWLNAYEYWLITGEWDYPAVSHGKKKL